jgi:hypothetical protein
LRALHISAGYSFIDQNRIWQTQALETETSFLLGWQNPGDVSIRVKIRHGRAMRRSRSRLKKVEVRGQDCELNY